MSATEVDLRDRIVSAGIFAYRAADFHQVTVGAVAQHADVTVEEFHRAYPVWELFIIAVIDRWSTAQQTAFRQIAEQDGAVAHVRARLETGLADPALVRLRLALLSAASNPGHAAAGWFRRQYALTYEDLTLALVRDVVRGRESRGVSPRIAAEQLLALYEGLQMQSLLRDDADVLPGFDRAVARMRVGWRSALTDEYTALR
ncbi:TetR/AcrR family transcriptional regulator [Microbacterium sp. M1A1_1b]